MHVSAAIHVYQCQLLPGLTPCSYMRARGMYALAI
jgi:hypothetical protein